MALNSEERKNYNKQYYQANRVNALNKACTPVNCPCCNRVVTRNRLTEHLKTKLCVKTQQNTNFINNRIGNSATEFVKSNPIV